jgi:hypothetical protein
MHSDRMTEFISTSSESIFEVINITLKILHFFISFIKIKLLKKYDKHLLRNKTTFSGFVDVYNVDKQKIFDRDL